MQGGLQNGLRLRNSRQSPSVPTSSGIAAGTTPLATFPSTSEYWSWASTRNTPQRSSSPHAPRSSIGCPESPASWDTPVSTTPLSAGGPSSSSSPLLPQERISAANSIDLIAG